MVAECYISLAATAPGRILWIGGYQLDTVPEKDVLRAWYKRLITVKKAYPALQSRNIENALIKPTAPRLIAYNRWEGNSSVTVIVNARNQHHTVIVRTKFRRQDLSRRLTAWRPVSWRPEEPKGGDAASHRKGARRTEPKLTVT